MATKKPAGPKALAPAGNERQLAIEQYTAARDKSLQEFGAARVARPRNQALVEALAQLFQSKEQLLWAAEARAQQQEHMRDLNDKRKVKGSAEALAEFAKLRGYPACVARGKRKAFISEARETFSGASARQVERWLAEARAGNLLT